MSKNETSDLLRLAGVPSSDKEGGGLAWRNATKGAKSFYMIARKN